jgi:Flp pilus assembly protein TadG
MMRRSRAERGNTLLESALVFSVFLILLAGIMEFAVVGFAFNSVTFAAHRAARFATLRGSSSGHPASLSDVQAEAQACIHALDPAAVTVTVTWSPDNHPGSSVDVIVTYGLKSGLVPVSAGVLTLKSHSSQIILQ